MDMDAETPTTRFAHGRLDRDIVAWRAEQLAAAGFPGRLVLQLAGDPRLDLHALVDLVERGCRPELAVRILAPLD